MKGNNTSRLREWAMSVSCWDGVYPLVVAAVASVVTMLPLRGLVEILAILIPVVVFLLRQLIGLRYFQGQHHYIWQRVVFFAATVLLALLDCFFILIRNLMNALGWGDWIMWGMLYASYFCMMAIAMFPIRECLQKVRSTE